MIHRDNNAVFAPSFNADESKESEVTENLVLLECVQDAFVPATHKGNIGSNGSKSVTNHCQNTAIVHISISLA